MFKKSVAFLLISVMILTLFAGCSKEIPDFPQKPEKVGENVVNPMVKSSYDEIRITFGVNFNIPENVSSPTYYIIGGDLAEINFYYADNTECTARIKKAEKREDISGMYYEWKNIEKIDVSECDGKLMMTKSDGKAIQVALWYDKYSGFTYSLSAMAKDLDGFDITAVAESFYIPAN